MHIKSVFFNVIIFVLFINTNSFAGKGQAHFVFSPKDKTIMVEKVKAYRKDVIGKNNTQESESEITTRVIYKKTENGWQLLATPLEITMKRDGKAINNPLFDILKSNSVKYKLTNSGEITGVTGYKSIKSDIYKKFEKDAAVKVANLFNQETMKKKVFAEWHQKTGRYIGKTVKNNEKWEDKETYTLPNGKSFEYQVEREFVVNYKLKDKDFVKIIVRYSTGNDEMVKKEQTFVSGSAEFIIDPDTMLLYSQKMERKIKMEMAFGKQGSVPVELHEKRVYSYEYRF